MAKLRICDVNDLFSLTGGGVRRYHLEKLRYLSKRDDLEYHLLLPSDRAGVEVHGNARLHHVPALALGGTGYRLMWNPLRLRRILQQIRPDVVEVGSWHLAPDYVRFAVRGLPARVVGFWHANYPVTDIGRNLGEWSGWLGRWGERLAWAWARRTYGRFDRTLVATEVMVEQLRGEGIDRLALTPLGVDTQMFHPRFRDPALRAAWGAGPDDVVLCFPNRLAEEKCLRALLGGYELLRAEGLRPLLVFAGHGPGRAEVEALAARYPEVKYLGYIDKPREMARVLASSDVVAVLSPWETFGLSAVEAMASGAALLGSGKMSIGELLRTCRCGVGLDEVTPRTVADAWLELMRPGRAALLGARGHQEANARYSWKTTFARIAAVYDEVVTEAALSRTSVAGLLADLEAPAEVASAALRESPKSTVPRRES